MAATARGEADPFAADTNRALPFDAFMQCGKASLKFREIESSPVRTPLHGSTPNGSTVATASPTFAAVRPPARKDRYADSVTNTAAGSHECTRSGQELYRRCCVAGIEEDCLHVLGSRAC
jgi:hypothetical protein